MFHDPIESRRDPLVAGLILVFVLAVMAVVF